MCDHSSSPRRARDGNYYTFAEFAQWYPDELFLEERWAEAAHLTEPTDTEDDTDSVASEQTEDVMRECSSLCAALSMMSSSKVTEAEGVAAAVRWTLRWLKKHPGSAQVHDGTPERYLPLRSAVDRFNIHHSQELVQAILNDFPSAATKNGAVRCASHQGLPTDLVAEIVRHGPKFGKLFEDKSWRWTAQTLAQVVQLFHLADRGDEIGEQVPVRLLSQHFTPDMAGLWLVMEAGASMLDSFDIVEKQLTNFERSDVLRTLRAWRHGEWLRRKSFEKSFATIAPDLAARTTARFLYGDLACPCYKCASDQQARNAQVDSVGSPGGLCVAAPDP